MIFDTTFLIDLQREAKRSSHGRATRFLQIYPDAALAVSVITIGEVLEGYPLERQSEAEEFFSRFKSITVDRAVASKYGAVSRLLRASGMPIGDNDLWIAATAMACGEQLVTRDADHFRRIAGLEVVGY